MIANVLSVFGIICIALVVGKISAKIKKLAKTGKQIVGITFIQSVGTFLFVSMVFLVLFLCMYIPAYLAFVFGGCARSYCSCSYN